MAGVAEPKSGKLCKFGHGLFGPKWTEKWVHLDHHVLKYFSMASEQTPRFSLSSARQSYSIILAGYDFVLQDDVWGKRITRKHAFHLLPTNKTSKAYVFACGSERELHEWQEAFRVSSFSYIMGSDNQILTEILKARSSPAVGADMPPVVAEKLRRASDAFTAVMRSPSNRPRGCLEAAHTAAIDITFLRVAPHWIRSQFTLVSFHPMNFLCAYVDWQGDISEYSLLQQQLDPNVEGKIAREQFLRVMQHYFPTRTRIATSVEQKNPEKLEAATTLRSSFSGQPSTTKRSEPSEPEAVSEMDPVDESLQANNALSPVADLASSDEGLIQLEDADLKSRNWQTEFIRLQPQDPDDDPIPRGLEMAAFMAEFRASAEHAVEEIVHGIAAACAMPSLSFDDDQFLATDYADTHERLRLSVTKYVVNDLLVYITHDEPTHKVFGHQLRAAQALHDAIMETNAYSLRVPLQCVVDYLGFRALVFGQLPHHTTHTFSSRMLVSCDRNHQAVLVKQLEDVGKQLGIFIVDVGDQTSEQDRLPLFVGASAGISTTVEDGRTVSYLHNLLDTFPAATPTEEPPLSPLRPEYVSALGETLPLHPQHWSPCFSDAQRAILEQAVLTADEHLQCVVLTAFVDAVETQNARVYDSFALTDALHREGIHARYLGLCYEAAKTKYAKSLFLSEIIGRAAKKELRECLQSMVHDAASHWKSQSDDNEETEMETTCLHTLSQETVQEFFNLVFGRTVIDSNSFWHDRILPRMQEQFVFSAPVAWTEILSAEDAVHWPQVLQAVLYHTRVSSDDGGDINFASSRPFVDADALCVAPHSTALCPTTHACKQPVAQTNERIAAGQIDQALENVKTQIAIEDIASRRATNPALRGLLIWAAELSLLIGQLEESEKFVSLALEASGSTSAVHARVLLVKIRVHHAQSLPLEKIQPLFEEAVRSVRDQLGYVHPLLLALYTTMIEISHDYGDHDGTFQLFHQVATLVKDSHGKLSVAYADIRRQEGDALVESGRLEDAASVYDEAFAVYERLVQENAGDVVVVQEIKMRAATCFHTIAVLQAATASSNGLEIAFSTAVRALSMRRDVLPDDHVDVVSSQLQLGELCVALGDLYRAIEYYRPALVQLKANATDDTLQLLRKVYQAMLNAHIQSLPAEKLAIVDKTKKRFATVSESLKCALTENVDIPSSSGEQSSAPKELELIRLVTHELLDKDPVDLLDRLLEKADGEWRSFRHELFASEPTCHEGVAEDPTAPAQSFLSPKSASASSRCASFAIGQPHPLPTTQPSTTTTSEPIMLLATSTGEFTYGAQLVALLFLASLPDE